METVMDWDTMDFCMELLKAEWKVNQQEGGEEFKCNYLAQDDGYVALKMGSKHREGWWRVERI